MSSCSCNLCGFIARSKTQLAGHLSGHVRRGELPKRPTNLDHECSICHRKFPSGSVLGGHIHSHKKFVFTEVSNDLRKRYLISERGHQCEKCKNTHWQNEKIPLDLDHIDGNPDNNEETNFRLLCPNCHRQTPSWGTRNKGKFPHSKRSILMKRQRSHERCKDGDCNAHRLKHEEGENDCSGRPRRAQIHH